MSTIEVLPSETYDILPDLSVSVGVELAPGNLWFVGQRLQVRASFLVYNTVEIVRAGGAEDAQDVVQLEYAVRRSRRNTSRSRSSRSSDKISRSRNIQFPATWSK